MSAAEAVATRLAEAVEGLRVGAWVDEALWRREVFGPVVAMRTVSSTDEAIE